MRAEYLHCCGRLKAQWSNHSPIRTDCSAQNNSTFSRGFSKEDRVAPLNLVRDTLSGSPRLASGGCQYKQLQFHLLEQCATYPPPTNIQ